MPPISELDQHYLHHTRRWFVVVMVGYVLIAVNFARLTPAWQAPDEPAHYNYIAHIATEGKLPVLRMGDYDQDYQSSLVGSKFAPELSIEPLRYEGYQPPLYYLLAAPLYWLTGGNLLALRLFGVVLGSIVILLLYHCVNLAFPDKPMVTLGATAFVAFLPMQVAVTAALNNDTLALLLLLAAAALLFQWMREQFNQASVHTTAHSRRQLLGLGVVLGLGLLTKIYAYLMTPLCLVAIMAIYWRGRAPNRPVLATLRQGIGASLWALAPALVLGLPWWVRNLHLYGGRDVLGLTWHDLVVAGQPRTLDWIQSNGLVSYSERAFGFTFKSFWGVFGWMSAFMDERIYTALLIFTGVLFLGLLWTLIRLLSGSPDTDIDDYQRWILIFLAVMLLAVLAGYIWYNLKFVQHQGRYFFWGLLPISVFVALGWREVMRPVQGAITGLLATVLALALAFTGYVGGEMDKWTILTIALTALLLLLQPLLYVGDENYTLRWVPRRIQEFFTQPFWVTLCRFLRIGAWMTPFLLLALLDALLPAFLIAPLLQ
ncbi:MAG: glycosyltransferase family 39 protein [Caldilineaceae bacterium]